jgi:ABC-2 type transport system permease protein
MRALIAIAQKDLRLLLRDKGEVFFTFVFPVILAVFFGFVFGGNSGNSRIELALVVESDARIAQGLAADLAADGAFEVIRRDTREAAIEDVRAGRVTAVVVLPASMQDGLDGLFAGGGIPIEAIVDPSRRAEAGLIQGKLNELAFRQFPRLMSDADGMKRVFARARASLAQAEGMSASQRLAASGMIAAGEMFAQSFAQDATASGPTKATLQAPAGTSTEEATEEATGTPVAATPDASIASSSAPAATRGWSPIAVRIEELPQRRQRPRSSFDVTFPQGLVWGLAGCIGAFASALVVERARGTLDRLRLAPIARWQLLGGKGLACFTVAMLVQLLLVGVAVVGFGSTVAQPLMLLVAFAASAVCFSGLAMLLAALCRTEAEANGAGRGAILILAMVGGGTIPLFFMPPFLRTISYGSPFRWAVTAIEGPFWRDLAVADQIVPITVLLGLGIGGFLIGARAAGRPLGRTRAAT